MITNLGFLELSNYISTVLDPWYILKFIIKVFIIWVKTFSWDYISDDDDDDKSLKFAFRRAVEVLESGERKQQVLQPVKKGNFIDPNDLDT